MKLKSVLMIGTATAVLAILGSTAMAAGDKSKSTVKIPGGLAFSEFAGFEDWKVVSVSDNGGMLAAIVGNPAAIEAYRSGIPDNGKPFPDGARLAKIHFTPKKLEKFPSASVPNELHDVDFMVKDSKRFPDSAGWGWAQFEYDVASDAYRASTVADMPPQGNDAKCGLACHTITKTKDYVFTEYGKR